ncbi:MAG: N-carbamoylputrescine amidase, partial [Spirochaetes bacterium]|nr:N-carbamoylputrescine amidase [Spirochaetota bacterium]
MSKIKIALIQMRVSSTVEENLSKSIGMIEEASQRGARIVMLPEMFVSPFDT